MPAFEHEGPFVFQLRSSLAPSREEARWGVRRAVAGSLELGQRFGPELESGGQLSKPGPTTLWVAPGYGSLDTHDDFLFQ